MSTHIVGLVPDNDPTYLKHKKIAEACLEADVSFPIETKKYFRWESEEAIKEKLEVKIPSHEWFEDMSEGFEIVISEIPKGVTKIRFYNSW